MMQCTRLTHAATNQLPIPVAGADKESNLCHYQAGPAAVSTTMARLRSKPVGFLAALSLLFSALCLGLLSPPSSDRVEGRIRRLAGRDLAAAVNNNEFAQQLSEAKAVHITAKFHHDPNHFRSDVDEHDRCARNGNIQRNVRLL
jgi:hypothetical protein